MKESVINEFMNEISDIRFETVEELYENKEFIRQNYQKMENRDAKEMYKWYFFYQLCIVKKLEIKRLLWYYLNSNGEDTALNGKISNEYVKFCKERERIINLNAKRNNKIMQIWLKNLTVIYLNSKRSGKYGINNSIIIKYIRFSY